jgi:hypothetical protein
MVWMSYGTSIRDAIRWGLRGTRYSYLYTHMFIIVDCDSANGGSFDGGMGRCQCPDPAKFKWKCDLDDVAATVAGCCEQSKYWPIN